jgi:CheY-like chemotaxis protein
VNIEDEQTWPGVAASRRPLRILVVDDNDDFRRQAAQTLLAVPRCTVAGFASSGEEAVEVERMIAPDLVLMDLIMTGIDGFEAARRIRARGGAARVVIMTLDAHPFRRAVAEQALADGLVSKSDFVREIKQVLATLFPDPPGLKGATP